MRVLAVFTNMTGRWLAVISAAWMLGGVASAQQPPPNPAHVHIGHVMTGWKDTPDMKGFLPTAMTDAQIAEEQAHKTDLEGRINDFILYGGYTLNALDPTPENKALIQTAYTRLPVGADPRLKIEIPGSGYGVKRAVAGALQHVQLAAKSEGASDNVKTHAMHVSTSLENVVKWTDEAIALAQKILVAKNVAEGQPLVTALEDTTVHINNGFDANKDGQIGWQAGEGGLEQALMHMRLMMRGEGMPDSAPAESTSSRSSDPAGTPEVASQPPPQQIAPDRMWAEWMLRMGGAVVLEGQRKPITDLADLPTTDFRIHTLNFTGITMYGASLQDELRHLPTLPHLKELYINGRLWYDQPAPRLADTMSLFATSTELEKLVLSRPVQTYIPMNDAALKQLAPLKNLKELRVRQTRAPGLELSPFPLTHLDLNYVVAFGDEGMKSLKGMRTLTELYVRGTSITDEGLKNLAGLTNLVELDLADDNVSDAGLTALAGLTKLRKLSVQGANVTDAGLDVLRNMPDLEELSLYRTKVSNAGLAKLAALKNLRAVDLRYSRVTGAGVRELTANLPNVDVLMQDSSSAAPKRTKDAAAAASQGEPAIAEWLQSIGGKAQLTAGHVTSVSLAATSVTDAELAILAKLPQLADLNLQHTEVSSVGLAHLSSIKSLRGLDLGDTLLGDESLSSLTPLKNLHSLRLEGTLVEGPGLAALAGLTNLRELYLDNAPLGNAGLDQIAKIYGLEVLSLRYTNVTDAGMARVGQLKNLQRLDLSSVDVTEKGLQSLAGLTNLVDLDLSFARFAEPGLQVLVTLPQLTRLGLEQTTVTDKAMAWIARLTNLEALNLNYTTVSDAGFAKLAGLTSLAELKLDRTDISDASLNVLLAQKNLRYGPVSHAAHRGCASGAGEGVPEMRDQLEPRLDAVAAKDVGHAMKNQILLTAALIALAATASAQTAAPKAPGAAAPKANLADAIAVQRIEARGGFVVRDRDGSISEVSLARTWATDEDLSYVARIGTLKRLDLSFTLVTDKGIKELEQLRQLEDLNLETAEALTDASMNYVKNIPTLRKLKVRGVDITDVGMPAIAQMTGLRSLDLSHTMLEDVGLENLPALTELEELYLGGDMITGINLNFLKLLPKLKKLSLDGIQRRNAGACWTPRVTDLDLDTISLLSGLEDLDLGVGLNLGRGGKPAAPPAAAIAKRPADCSSPIWASPSSASSPSCAG